MMSFYTNLTSPANRAKEAGQSNDFLIEKPSFTMGGYNLTELLYLNVDKTKNKLILMKAREKKQSIDNDILKKRYHVLKGNEISSNPKDLPLIASIKTNPEHSSKQLQSSQYSEHRYHTQSFEPKLRLNPYDHLYDDAIALLQSIHEYKTTSTQLRDKKRDACFNKLRKHNPISNISYKKQCEELSQKMIEAEQQMRRIEIERNEAFELYEKSRAMNEEEVKRLIADNDQLKEGVANLKEKCDSYVNIIEQMKSQERPLEKEYQEEEKQEQIQGFCENSIEDINDIETKQLIYQDQAVMESLASNEEKHMEPPLQENNMKEPQDNHPVISNEDELLINNEKESQLNVEQRDNNDLFAKEDIEWMYH